jgi:hypothetical protein
MSTTIMDFRVREEMAGAVLKEVAALDPAERMHEAHSLTQIMGQAVQALEGLWGELRDPLQGGVSPSEAATLGRILTRSANFIASSLELLVGESPSLEEFKKANVALLQRIKGRAAGRPLRPGRCRGRWRRSSLVRARPRDLPPGVFRGEMASAYLKYVRPY